MTEISTLPTEYINIQYFPQQSCNKLSIHMGMKKAHMNLNNSHLSNEKKYFQIVFK